MLYRIKWMFFCLSLPALMIPFTTKADFFEDISYSIESGNANELAADFANRIELTISGEEGDYSRRQAEVVLNEFFEENDPEDFEVIHKGSSNHNARYAIGYLETSNGTYRSYVFVKENEDDDDEVEIQELRFEKE